MNPDRPSKNLITTLPSTASQTTTSARWCGRSLPSTLPSKCRPDASSSSVARWILASPLPFSSPIESRATRGDGDAEHALREDRAHPGVLGEVLGGRIGVGADVEQHHRPGVRDHLDGERRAIDAGQPAEAQDRGGHARAGMPGGHHGVRLAALDQVHRDEDRGVLLLAHGERRMLVHADDLGGVDDRDVRRQRSRRSIGSSARRRPGSPGPRDARRRDRARPGRPRPGRGRRPWRRPRRGPRRPSGSGSRRRRRGHRVSARRRRAGIGFSWMASRPL